VTKFTKPRDIDKLTGIKVITDARYKNIAYSSDD
jgi:hypothetical protein